MRENAGDKVLIGFQLWIWLVERGVRVFLDQSQSEVKHKRSDNCYFRHLKKQAFVWHDISSMSRDFRGNRLTVLYAGYKKLSKDGDWVGVTACSLSVLHKFSGTIPR